MSNFTNEQAREMIAAIAEHARELNATGTIGAYTKHFFRKYYKKCSVTGSKPSLQSFYDTIPENNRKIFVNDGPLDEILLTPLPAAEDDESPGQSSDWVIVK